MSSLSPTRAALVALFAAGIFLVAASCSDPEAGAPEAPRGAVSNDAGSAADAVSPPSDAGVADVGSPVVCPKSTGRGPEMIGVGSFCIDATPVSAVQYSAFVAASVAVDAQPAECAWNDSFEPSKITACAAAYRPTTAPHRPVVCVDWCDAAAFCKWAGKRLCGRIENASVAYGAYDPK